MDPSQSEQLQTFMSVTGASEAVAWDKLQAHRGDLNAAINSFFNEGENPVPPVQSQAADRLDWMEEDEPPSRQPIVPPSYLVPLAPAWASADAIPPRFPFRGTVPIVSQPRDVREVPIDWRDEEQPRVRSLAGPQIEEIPETENAHLSLQSHVHFISDDDEVSGPASAVVRAGSERPSPFGSNNYGEFLSGNENLNAPSINEVPAMANNEGHDIEEEMLRAAIEASRKEATGTMGPAFAESLSGARVDGAGMRTEDDDLAWAVSQSLKTAEQEKAMREGKGYPGFPEGGFLHEDENNYPSPENCKNRDIPKRKESSSARGNYSGESGTLMKSSLPPDYPMSDIPVSHANTVSKDPVVDVDEFEEPPLLRRRSGRGLNPTLTPPSEIDPPAMPEMHQGPSNTAGVPAHPSASFERNGDVTQNDEWGGLSSEEQEEAVMLEAAMFGSLPEDSALRFRYPSVVGGIVEDADGNLSDDGQPRNYARPIPQPPSPTVIAQRRLREQQDDEYLASLEADREKEARAQLEEEARRMKEEEDKAAAHEEEKLWQEEDLRKRLAEEELERQIAAKRAALPKEPSIDDESAVTLMVRMPDGSRQGRRFHKSEPLQCLFDFVDVSGGVVPGSYRLVRQYPRKVFTDAEHGNSLYDLGLSSKYETLFLELI